MSVIIPAVICEGWLPMKSRFTLTNALALMLSLSVSAAFADSPAKSEHDKGVELAAKSSYEEAITHFNKAIELDPNDSGPRIERAIAYMHLKDYKKTLEDCDAVAGNDKVKKGDKREAYMIGAGASNMLGDYAKSVDYATKAISIYPGALIYADRALAHKQLGHLSEALADADQAIKLNANSASLYALRGAIYGQLARADFSKVKELGSK